ncbi:hypothetical protein P7K49_030597, partial [Saguinus oedipus]
GMSDSLLSPDNTAMSNSVPELSDFARVTLFFTKSYKYIFQLENKAQQALLGVKASAFDGQRPLAEMVDCECQKSRQTKGIRNGLST